jgi:hypothetical protein
VGLWVTRSVIQAPVRQPEGLSIRRGKASSPEKNISYDTKKVTRCAALALRQVRLLSRRCKLPFALLKTTAVIPFTILIDGVNGMTVLNRLEAPCAFLILEIVGKPHTKSPRLHFCIFELSYFCTYEYMIAFSEKHHLIANGFRRMLLAQPHDTPDHFANRAPFLMPVKNTCVRVVGCER